MGATLDVFHFSLPKIHGNMQASATHTKEFFPYKWYEGENGENGRWLTWKRGPKDQNRRGIARGGDILH